jgi:predicted amidophosphoribosyltransferase
MAESLGDLLAVQCELAWGPSPFDVVVPIPMPWLRKTWRGIDHSAMLARRVARAFRVPVAPLLVHAGGRTQVGRSRTERLRRRCPFRIHEPTARRLERGGRLMVIDDVRSTGSTLRHAVSLLKERIEGVEVRVAVAAIAEREVGVWPS